MSVAGFSDLIVCVCLAYITRLTLSPPCPLCPTVPYGHYVLTPPQLTVLHPLQADTVGDAYVAVTGLPTCGAKATSESVSNIAHLALEMLGQIANLDHENESMCEVYYYTNYTNYTNMCEV